MSKKDIIQHYREGTLIFCIAKLSKYIFCFNYAIHGELIWDWDVFEYKLLINTKNLKENLKQT